MLHSCVSKRHAFSDVAEAQRCCANMERTGDKGELLKQQKARKQTISDLERQVTTAQEEATSLENLRAKLEDSLAQAKAKRQEILSKGQIPESDSALASLPSDIEHVKGQIKQKRDEIDTRARQLSSEGESLRGIGHELARIELHAKRDSIYREMESLIEQWNERAAQLDQLRRDAGHATSSIYTLSDIATGEFAVLPPPMVRFGGSGRPALKAIGLRADVDPSQMGSRFGMFV